MHEDVKKQLIEQATGLEQNIRSAECQLVALKEQYLKVQGALEVIEHLCSEEARKIDSNEDQNVEGNDSQ